MNKMYLVLGDWSKDGHNQSEEVLLESNVDVKTIQEAYKASCKLTGVSFNDSPDYTGRNKDREEADEYQIATEYERAGIPAKALQELLKHGFREDFWNKKRAEDLEKAIKSKGDLYYEDFTELWIWFVKLSLPKGTTLRQIDDTIPNINGYWDKNLNTSFGYGLYQ